MQFQAVVANAKHPEYGVATIPFPIKKEDYDAVIELLRPLEIGDAVNRDCLIREISGEYLVLRRLEETTVNLDELDYLAKRLDGFDEYEKTQFQGMAEHLSLWSVEELINLTFCCQEATVITDFTDLDRAGRRHFLTMNGGGAPLEDVDKIDAKALIGALIGHETGHITPYGVVYDNGMQLAQLYDGRHFPQYSYEQCVMEVEVIPEELPHESKPSAFLSLPLTELQLERALMRGDCLEGDVSLWLIDSRLPKEVAVAIDFELADIAGLNRLCRILDPLTQEDLAKLGAVVAFAEPTIVPELGRLAQQLDLFDFVPGVRTPEEYGRYMIRDSEHFEYDENLADFYDYKKYGHQRVENESGQFVDCGYISYHGTLLLDELMMEDPTEQGGFQMGGLE